MELKLERQGDVHLIIAEGEMVTGEADILLKQAFDGILRGGDTRVVVDFSAVPYIDSSVLGQLVHGYSLLKKKGGGLKLLNPSPRILDLLSLTRLITIFEIHKDRGEAINSWKTTEAK